MAKKLAILGYHKIGAPSAGGWETWYYVPTATFEKQMRQLQDAGWCAIDASKLLAAIDTPEILPDRSVLITFDDGYRSVLREAAPVLLRMRLPAVIFVPTRFIGSASTFDENSPEPLEPICSWSELGELERAGISVQSHGVSHRAFSELSPDQIEWELTESKAALQRGLNKKVQLFSYPYNDPGVRRSDLGFGIWDFAGSALFRAGYKAAFHFLGGVASWPLQDLFHITRVPVWPDSNLLNEL